MRTTTIGLARLALRNIAFRPARSILVATASVLGAALVVATAGVQTSMVGSLERLDEVAGIADIQVVSTSDAGMPFDVVSDLVRVEGVTAVAPVIRSVGAANGTRVLILGADERLAAFAAADSISADTAAAAAALLSAPRQDGVVPVVVGQRLARKLGIGPTDELTVAGGSARTTARVAATVDVEINAGNVVIGLLDEAAQLAGSPGRSDEILVQTDDGTDESDMVAAVESAVAHRGIVTTSGLQVQSVQTIIATFVSTFGLVALMGLALGGFVVHQTVRRVAVERRREMATLRAIGGEPGPLVAMLVFELTAISAVGAAVGSIVGLALGARVVDAVPFAIEAALGAEITFVPPTAAIVGGFVLATGTAVAASWRSARAAARVSPTDAMRPADVHHDDQGASFRPVLLLAAVVTVGLGVAITVSIPPPNRNAGMILVVGGTLMAIRALLAQITTVAAAVASRFGAAGPVAAEAITRAPDRIFTTTASIAIAVGLMGGFLAGIENTQRAARDNVEALSDIDLLLATAPPNEIPIDFVLADSVADEIAAHPAVDSVEQGHFAATLVDGKRVVIEAIEGDSPPVRQSDPAVRDALLAGEGVVVSRQFDVSVGATVGEPLRLITPTGVHEPIVLDVAPITGFPGGSLYLSTSLFEEWYERDGFSFLGIRLVSGADVASAQGDISAMVEDPALPIHLISGDEQADASEQVVLDSMSLVLGVTWLLLAGAALVTLNTFVLLVLQRRRELGVLRAIGASPGHVRTMVIAEVAGTVAGGAIAGLPFGALLSYLTGFVVGGALGFDVPFRVQPAVAVLSVLAAVAVAVAGSIVPARRAARVPVVEAIGYE